MADDHVSQRPHDSAVLAAIPPTPVAGLTERWTARPFVLLDGNIYSIGWQYWAEKKGGPGFVILRVTRGVMSTHKVVERFPLSDEGWAQAWKALVRLDPDTAEDARAVLARRARADGRLRGHDVGSLAYLRQVIFLGGYLPGAELAVGKPYDVQFLQDRLAVCPCHELQPLAELPYGVVEAVDIGGPGLVRSGGGFIGGGFGAVGAAEGMAIAGVLNALTTRTRIKTVIRVQATSAELFFLHTRVEPEPMRIELSRAIGAVREAQASRPSADHPKQPLSSGSLVDELAKLGSLLERGLLSREEFDQLKARLIADA